jgi:dCMP deaminase
MNEARPNWDETWLAVALVLSERSVCTRAQVGAVIVDKQNRVVSTGYNGQPAGMDPRESCYQWCPRSHKQDYEIESNYADCFSIHAEMNALTYGDRSRYEGGTLYVTSTCCWDCGKVVGNSGIKRVVMLVDKNDKHREPDATLDLLAHVCNIEVYQHPR